MQAFNCMCNTGCCKEETHGVCELELLLARLCLSNGVLLAAGELEHIHYGPPYDEQRSDATDAYSQKQGGEN